MKKRKPFLLDRDFLLSKAGLCVVATISYVIFIGLCFLVKGEFLYWLKPLGISGLAYKAIGVLSCVAGFVSFAWISHPFISTDKRLSDSKISKEQFIFFATCAGILWFVGTDGRGFWYTVGISAVMFVNLQVARWERYEDENR